MKLKGLTKLALSGVALAAVAATLGTSTYAWYVANSKATVSGVTGSTSTSTGGNLLLNGLTAATNATDSTKHDVKETGNWTNTLELSNITVKSISEKLLPITKSSTAGQWNNVKGQAVSNGYNYYMFGAWVSDNTQGSTNVNVKVAITNTSVADNVQGQTCYTTNGAPNGAQVNSTFKEDAVYALKLDVYTVALEAAIQETVLADSTNRTSYSFDTATKSDFSTAYQCLTNFKSDGNAHTYYKALSTDNVTNGTTIDGGELADSDFGTIPSAGIPLSLTNGTKYIVLVRYWLDGADPQCFDSCTGQSFQIDLKLEVPSTNS